MTRASVFAWLHIAACTAANASTTNSGVSSAIDSDVAAPESPDSRVEVAGTYGADGDCTGVLAVVRT